MTSIREKANKAHGLYEELKVLIRGRDNLIWKEAEILYDLKEQKLFKFVFGTDIDENEKSWKSFLGEIGVPLGTADFKISLHKKWIIELEYSPSDLMNIHTRKLQRAIPYVTKSNAKEILEKAKHLSFGDFLAEITGKEPCHHESKEEKKVAVCTKCGKKIK